MTVTSDQATCTLALNGLTVTTALSRGAATTGRRVRPSAPPVLTPDDDDLPDGCCFRRPPTNQHHQYHPNVDNRQRQQQQNQYQQCQKREEKQVLHKTLKPKQKLQTMAKQKTMVRRASVSCVVKYMGSFPVSGQDHTSRAEFMRSQLLKMRGTSRTKPVLLVISLAGIKVCTPDGKSVLMAHALRRVSYATCDPSQHQFSFLAREPRAHCSLQCCHSFLAKNQQQAEELHAAVGDAFRAAYVAQLQGQTDVTSQQQQADMEAAQRLRATLPPRSMPPLTDDSPSSDESNSPTELNSYRRLADKPPLVKRLTCLANNHNQAEESRPLLERGAKTKLGAPPSEDIIETSFNSPTQPATPPPTPEKQVTPRHVTQLSGSSSGSQSLPDGPTPPPLPERLDSLGRRLEGEQLGTAPWFQAGIPREIALEVLGREPEGAFMVRESTSKPGCFALSLRVPRDFQPSGIAHYLILRTTKGFKIKGFTKDFPSLTALITHHSVMPELLPCPLSLSRYNPSFAKSDSSKDFADVDSDPDYNTLSDFRKMLGDLSL